MGDEKTPKLSRDSWLSAADCAERAANLWHKRWSDLNDGPLCMIKEAERLYKKASTFRKEAAKLEKPHGPSWGLPDVELEDWLNEQTY